jgi:hypothetical protein
MKVSDDAVWQRLHALMPRHDCGRRLVPGGFGGRPVLVCVPCASIEEVDPDWAADMAAEAQADITADPTPQPEDRQT